jgi:hypothetical protein
VGGALCLKPGQGQGFPGSRQSRDRAPWGRDPIVLAEHLYDAIAAIGLRLAVHLEALRRHVEQPNHRDSGASVDAGFVAIEPLAR